MKPRQFTTKGIVLTRTDYGEADRILTFLTDDHGKVRAIAKSVRKSTSKLAGSIEIFSVSEITLLQGRGELKTLISARLNKHFSNIVKDIERTNTAYEFMRLLSRATEDAAEPAYFTLLELGLEGLDDPNINPQLSSLWFNMQLLKLAGHTPNLRTDGDGSKLQAGKTYSIDLERMLFELSQKGNFSANHIKFLRVGFASRRPKVLQRVQEADVLAATCQPLIQTMLKYHVRA